MERSTIKAQLNSLSSAPVQTAQLAHPENTETRDLKADTYGKQTKGDQLDRVVRRLTVICAAVIVLTVGLGAVTVYSDVSYIDREHRDGQ